MKLSDLLKKRVAIVAALPELALAEVDAQIAAAEAEERATQAAKDAEALAEALAVRDAAERDTLEALAVFVAALGPLEQAEGDLRALGEPTPAGDGVIGGLLRGAARAALQRVAERERPAAPAEVPAEERRRHELRRAIAWQEHCAALARQAHAPEREEAARVNIARLHEMLGGKVGAADA